MTVTLSVAARNAELSGFLTELGSSPILKMRTGAQPATVATASTGTVLATCNLPTSPFTSPSGGSISKNGTWEDLSADATGNVGHFEITKSDGTTVVLRGSVTITGGGGDMTVDSVSFTAGQGFSVTSFTRTRSGAS